jgi:CheY-like chemotaxis protein
MGNASLIEDEASGESARHAAEIVSSAERAASLTRQLLAYAGKGQFVVSDLDVSHAVQEISGLVEFSIPKSVQLVLNVQRRLPAVRMDPSQLQQILMNLVINGGEAIGEGNSGKITVSTGIQDVESPFRDAAGQQVAPQRYVCVDVKDSGAGIPREKLSRIFDPFFTTKFIGRGLGLAAVAGILRSQGGGITVESAEGEGTTFRVLLPAAESHAGAQAPAAGDGPGVLVVDDEASVREFISTVLRRRHYRVWTAADGREALGIWERLEGAVDAVVLDVVMPLMGANELLPQMKARRPGLKVLLTSGYSESEARRLCAAYPGAAFIQKPYTARQIANAVERLVG